ncbi:MAG: glycoside hydrolase family 2 protein [Firmicutes bacterium]|nr:glycoside hydrolase family 2 protein [Bacillota bacterium]
MFAFNDNWEFTREWKEAFLRGEGEAEAVRLPHTVRELPLHAIDNKDYQMISGYRKHFRLPEGSEGRRFFLQFDAAGHIATVYVNGKELLTNRCGYTAFRAEFTDAAVFDGDNLVAVKLDSTENPAIPPFGFVIDYLTYGGLYRPAWLDITEKDRIDDVFVYTPDLETACVRVSLDLSSGESAEEVILTVLDENGNAITQITGKPEEDVMIKCPGVTPWCPEDPAIYTLRAELQGKDTREVHFGFRAAEFRSDGFYLNGRKIFLRGLNRHQSWPYVGYAAPASMQIEDARIAKVELGLNAIRTSHYPQSQDFIDACDRLGLMVFTEIPGWQHLGGPEWKDQAKENVREMILQYRNHPSIILWGVRINESLDDDELYKETNRIAHELDPSRMTSGVRYLEHSSLLEDVYAFNDFTHTGDNRGAKPKSEVSNDQSKAFLISEHNGHMFPTKSFDTWERRQEQALRHARVLNDSTIDGEHAGCFGWCMFDYPTHRDFGSGDRMCYHGVMDAFRNPKPAAALYASQQDERPVLEISSSMDIGDYPGGQIGTIYAFTNADQVRLSWKDSSMEDFRFLWTCENKPYGLIPHSPIAIDDPITHTWGGEASVWKFEAVKDGDVKAIKILGGNGPMKLETIASSLLLEEKDTWDMAAVRVRITDGYDNVCPYVQLPIRFEIEGDAELIGPDIVTAEGGMCGTYIRTVGREGRALLTVKCNGMDDVRLTFDIKKK